MKKSCFQKNTVFFFIIIIFCTAQSVFAHKVTIFAWKEGDTVFTESQFSGGKRVNNGRIEVYDYQGGKILEGKTDDQGRFSFTAPEKTGLDIVLKAGAGHQNHWKIPFDANKKTVREMSGETIKPEKIQVTPKELEGIVESIMDKKLKPVITMLVDQRNSDPSVTDILGGIGYIIGLVGVAALFKSRNRKGR